MKAEDFKVGDMVRLNCSSTRMMVDKIDEGNVEGAIACIWLNDADDLVSGLFHPQQLINLGRPR